MKWARIAAASDARTITPTTGWRRRADESARCAARSCAIAATIYQFCVITEFSGAFGNSVLYFSWKGNPYGKANTRGPPTPALSGQWVPLLTNRRCRFIQFRGNAMKRYRSVREYEKVRRQLFRKPKRQRKRQASAGREDWVPCGGGYRRLLTAGSGGE
jgi:hypothetical protein